MWPYYPELLAVPVPRYTSFPTAAEFGSEVTPADYEAAIAKVEGDVSLYVHIPFCEKICWYCGCNTGAANRKQRLASYLDALHREIALVGARLPAGARVRRVAFGGGSPNAIAPYDFVRLIDELTLHFRLEDPIFSIELDPRTLTEDWGPVISGIGATHASLGVQTFSSHLQERIGRIQPLCMIERSTRMLRNAGITSLNFDLMYGLPGQEMGDLESSLDLANQMGADRIALFGYAHVPHLIPRQRQIDASALPDADARFSMAQFGHTYLTHAGYQPVGFDHFALPADPLAQAAKSGQLSRNFQGFTEDTAPVLIGLGASSISSFPDLLIQNEKNSGRYRMMLSQDQLPLANGISRSAEDQKRGEIVRELLCHGRARITGQLRNEVSERLAPYLDHDLCTYEGQDLVISADATPYMRSIAAAFDPYRKHSPRRFSSAV
ncbi:oxygen-independent coproporphyrinogen III oxidase [Altericroceibacterium endophyticum]|uniref:Coproporphyrinogen-III oxidase n=1 Tax=Altericroceibacterium endophyticum TaxID=1808508 RepID=A0A6I4T2I2_9SPHN|nr:oxygen-independent coproporphyrinogen III oxidase [Altericroceibacterium endophyticum]MXO65147.1 oxygen-independent coproporphyrinogen III oxidase [Altericroceibacterium endophyticum]